MIFLLLLLLLHFANIWRKFPLSILLTPAVAIRNELIKRSVISRLHVFVWRTGYGRGNTINTRMHRRINICSTFCKNQRKWCQATFPQINTAVTRSFWKKLRRSSLFIRGSASIKLGRKYQQENWRHVVLPLLIKEERSDEDRSSWLTIIDIPTKNRMEHGYSVGNLQWKLLRKSVAEIAV